MTRPPSKLRTLRLVLWGFVGLALAAFVALVGWRFLEARNPHESQAINGRPGITGAFSLVDQGGRAVTEKTYRGKWLLIYFGYTNCPDICPTTMNEIAEVMDGLGVAATKVQPLMISIDPARDTPKALAKFTAAFDSRIVGLTGTLAQVKAAATAYRVFYAKEPNKSDPKQYTMTHSAYLYLMRPDGRFARVFAYGDDTDAVVAGIRKLF